MGLRITTWNVNGIRNPFGYQPWRDSKTFEAMFDILEADIVIMQELKIQKKDLRDDMVLVPGWDCYFSLPKHKKGYSGVGIYTRQSKCAPIRAEEGLLGVLCPPNSSTKYRDLPDDACIGGYPTPSQIADLGVDPAVLDAEGRCLVLEFPAFVLFGVYSPANSNGQRDDFRYGFICALDTRIRNLAKMGKRVVLTGDLNVSREEIDTAKAEEHIRAEGLTRDDYLNAPNRRIFNQLLEGGKVPGKRDEGRETPVLWDICRGFHENREGMFTHWEQKINARPANFGSRIDYVICSIEMKSWFSDSNIQEGLMGSDHCPVYAILKDTVQLGEKDVGILDIMNPSGMFEGGKRLRDFNPAKDLLPLSGRRLPEFDKRRSIKDMFTRKASVVSSQTHSSDIPKSLGLVTGTSKLENPKDANLSVEAEKSPKPSDHRASEKRRLDVSPVTKSVKRSKSNVGSSPRKGSRGQQSLKGFFRSNSSVSKMSDAPTEGEGFPTSSAPEADKDQPSNFEQTKSPSAPIKSDTTNSSTKSSTDFIDPEASKESWTKLFSRKPPPRCEGHAEPCVSYTTKKAGMNFGRQFWTCPRPIGPSGNKERGTPWRCGTFIWASDWNAPDSS